MAKSRRQFWRNRFHDLAAILLFACIYTWLEWAPPLNWRGVVGIGYNNDLRLIKHGDFFFKQDFMIQGRQPFYKVFGGNIGSLELIIATNGSQRKWVAIAPFWFVSSFLAIPMLISILRVLREPRWRNWMSNLVRRRRLRAGLCPECGYDLRATPNRCPECGTSAAINR